jgi:HEAT repeat protein
MESAMNHLTLLARGLLFFVLIVGTDLLATAAEEANTSNTDNGVPNLEDMLQRIGSHDKNLSERYPVFLELVAREKACHDVLPVLVRSLESKDSNIRCAAVNAIGYVAPKGKDILPTVEQLIDDKDCWVRLGASESAWIIGRSEKAVRETASLLNNPDRSIRAYAALLITDMGEGAASVASKLVDRLSEPDEIVGLCIIQAIEKMGDATINPLLEKTQNSDAHTHALAILCLGDMKISDQRITKAILVAMDDTEPEVRLAAIAAVSDAQIRKPLMTKKLVTLLNDPEDSICESAAYTIAKFGVNKAIPALERILKDRCKVREAIVTALGQMGTAAIPTLERAKDDPDYSVRDAAFDSLQRIQSEIKKSNSTRNHNIRSCKRHKCRFRCIRCVGRTF